MNPFLTHGAISWNEYLAIDPSESLDFYAKVIGWKPYSMEMQMEGGGTYHVVTVEDGTNAAGFMKRPHESIPPGWGFYVTVRDARSFADKNASNLFIPYTESPVGPFCGIVDPQGGMIQVMQYHQPEGEAEGVTNHSAVYSTPGLFSWYELSTPDGAGAAAFYSDIFGWTYKENKIPGGVYRHIVVDGTEIGGIAEMPDVEQAFWHGYITAKDIDKQTEIAASLGSTILVQPFDFPDVGRMSYLRDPLGAHLSLMQYGDDFKV